VSIRTNDIDFAGAKDALTRMERILDDFGFSAPEDTEKAQHLLTKMAAAVNDFAISMQLIRPRSWQK
jgi:hypothetical protein